MKIQVLLCLLSLTPGLSWRVDRRCLEEGQLLAGEDVEQMLKEGELSEEFDLDDAAFPWDDYPLLDTLDENFGSLRGSKQMLFQNQTSHFSNTSRSLQSRREFNLKLTWKQGACWQDEWIERKCKFVFSFTPLSSLEFYVQSSNLSTYLLCVHRVHGVPQGESLPPNYWHHVFHATFRQTVPILACPILRPA